MFASPWGTGIIVHCWVETNKHLTNMPTTIQTDAIACIVLFMFLVPITSSFIAELVSLFVCFVPFVQWLVLVCSSASEHHVQAHVSP
jgi:hypothetical protein